MILTPYDFLPVLTCFCLALGFVPLGRWLAIRLDFVDLPGGRKQHEGDIPPVGGLVIFPIFIIVVSLFSQSLDQLWPLYAGLFILLVVGAVDDSRGVRPWIKFTAQFLAAFVIVIPGGAELDHLGNLFGFGKFYLGFMSIPFSVIATVLLINAINLMDGLDGLAGGKSFVIFLWFVIACLISGDGGSLLVLLPLLGCLGGFLFYNMRSPWRKKAGVFLGDAGSLSLGLMIAWFAIHLAKGDGAPLVPISVAWVLALPIIDTCGQFARRVKEGRHPFSPDRGHFHHHLIHAGIPVGQSTGLILLLGFILGAIGYIGVMIGVPQWFMASLWTMLLISHIILSMRPQNYVSFFNRFTKDA